MTEGWLLFWIFFGVAAVVVVPLIRAHANDPRYAEHYVYICSTCGSRNNGKSFTRGSIFIEIILWICFLVPGVIYSIWRLTTRNRVCCTCGAAALIPLDSPVGRELAAKYPARLDVPTVKSAGDNR